MRRISLAYLVLLSTAATLQAQAPQWDWVKALHTSDDERATAVSSDPNTGEVYLVCQWEGSLAGSIPGGPTEATDFTSTFGNFDGLIVKMDPGSNVLWAFKAGGEGDDYIYDIQVDESGHFYICGMVGPGNCSFAGTGPITADSEITNSGSAVAFLAKYDSGGVLVWVRFPSKFGPSLATGVAINPDGIFMIGKHSETISFPPLPPYPSKGGEDMFLVKYSPDGDPLWHVGAGTGGNDYARGIACDETAVFMGGNIIGNDLEYRDPLGNTIDSNTSSVVNNDDIFLASFDLDGFHQWTRTMGGNSQDRNRGITMDMDHVYVAGKIEGEADFPFHSTNPVPHTGGEDAFVCSIERSSGETRWVRTLAGDPSDDQDIDDISLGVDGLIYITGYFINSLITANTTIVGGSNEDGYLAAFSRNGDEEWIKTTSGSDKEMGIGVCAATPGKVYLAGNYNNKVSFDTIQLPDDGSWNVFLASLTVKCMGVKGGQLTVSDTVGVEGESVDLVLKDYMGVIRWEYLPEGSSNWMLLTSDFGDSIQVILDSTSDYRAFVTSTDCSPDSSNVVRVEVAGPNIHFADAGEDVKICPGDSTNLKASGGDAYTWNPPEGLDRTDIPDPWARPRTTTTYVVTVVNADGATDTDTVTVFVLPRPSVDAGANQHHIGLYETFLEGKLGPEEKGTWSVVSGGGVFDDPHNPGSRVSSLEVGDNIFAWRVTNEVCPAVSDQVIIRIEDFIIPTVITPNGDGKNDRFHVEGILEFPTSELIILTQWGEVVYRAAPYLNDWDGRDNSGRDMPEDTYFSVLKIKSNDVRKGNVIIIR